MKNTFKEQLLAGKYMVGTEVDLCDPCITEMVGQLGYDFLWLDTEHEATDYQTLLAHIIAAKAAGTASLVRIPWNEPFLAKRVLEMGPDAIIFPMISTAEELKKAVDSCLYPPIGNRGFGPRRACHYGAEDLMDYIRETPDRICCLAQIETEEAVRNLDEMVKIPYVSGFIIGPCDLSGSIGRLNDIYHPEVVSLIETAAQKCRKAGIPIGMAIGPSSEKELSFWRDKGMQFMSVGNDITALVTYCREQYRKMRRVFPKE